MLLKVGELAKRTGLTVRTLHHYDAVGLLKPSARSPSGYRLYDAGDVARLHAICALRQLGLSLPAIAELLAAPGMPLAEIVARQIRALDQEIAQARELRSRLSLLETALATGAAPGMEDALATLELMSAYRRHFSAAELRKAFRNWKATQADWSPLIAETRAAQAAGLGPETPDVQRLAQRWMDLSMRWMQGDLGMARRWGEMVRIEPAADGANGLDQNLLGYIGEAMEMRMTAILRHLSPEDLNKLDKGLAPAWSALAKRARQLQTAGERPGTPAARALAADWEALVNRTVRDDPALRAKFLQAYRSEPLLQAGHVIEPELRAFIESLQAQAA